MNNKALVVGGTSGIGGAISQKLIKLGYEKVYVIGRSAPDFNIDGVEHIAFDLINDNIELLKSYTDVDTFVFTAGIGRMNYFETFSPEEIDAVFKTNTISVIKLIHMFYDKINSPDNFNCAVVSSISGHIASPLYSVYGASKTAVSQFIENINAELSANSNVYNRILDVSPGRILGTKFHNGENDYSQLEPLASEIIDAMFQKDTLYIPNRAVYDKVLSDYRRNPQAFAASSIDYKLTHSELETRKPITIGYLTGSFDLFHIGHLNILKRAKEHCDYLIVGVHTDGSHKGKELFIPLEERMAIVESCKYVDKVFECTAEDTDAYEKLHYDYLFVGSDYKGSERFNQYEAQLAPFGVKIVYFPYTDTTSSTKLRNILNKCIKNGNE